MVAYKLLQCHSDKHQDRLPSCGIEHFTSFFPLSFFFFFGPLDADILAA